MVNNIMALFINDAELSTHTHPSGKAAKNSEGGNGFIDALKVLVKDEPASRPRTKDPEKKTGNQNAEKDEAAHPEVRADVPASTLAVTRFSSKPGRIVARIGTGTQKSLAPNDVSAASAQKPNTTSGPSGVSFRSAQPADGMPNKRNSQATTVQLADSTDSIRDILTRATQNGQQISPEDRKQAMQQLINTLTQQQAGEVQNNANQPAGILNAQNAAGSTDSIRDIIMRATQNGKQISPEDRKQAMQQLINTLTRQQPGHREEGAVPDQSETAKPADRSSALSTPSVTRQNLPAGLQIRPPAMSPQTEIPDVQTLSVKKSVAAIRTSGTPEADLSALNTIQTNSDGLSLRLARTPGDNLLTPTRENLAMNLQYTKNQSAEAGLKDAVVPDAPKTSPATTGTMAAFMAGMLQATRNSQAHLRQVDHRQHLRTETEPAKPNRNVSETDNARQMLSRVRVSNPGSGGSKGFDTPSDNRDEQGRFAGNTSGTQASNSSNSTTETPRTPDMPQPQRALQAGVTQQVSQQALQAVRNGMSEVRIDLKPESLGKLRMHISTADGQVTLKIIAETPQAKALIESDLQQLRTELKNQGLEMDKCQILTSREAEQRDNPRQQGDSRPAGASANAFGGSVDGDDETLNAAAQATGIEDGRVSLFA